MDEKKLTPEQVMMNALADVDRVEHLVICMYTKDGCYESWSNNLPSHIRIGLMKTCLIRAEATIETADEEVE